MPKERMRPPVDRYEKYHKYNGKPSYFTIRCVEFALILQFDVHYDTRTYSLVENILIGIGTYEIITFKKKNE